MLGTAIPGYGRWFENSVVFGMKIVLTVVKKKDFCNNSRQENCEDEIEFHFSTGTLQLRIFSVW